MPLPPHTSRTGAVRMPCHGFAGFPRGSPSLRPDPAEEEPSCAGLSEPQLPLPFREL